MSTLIDKTPARQSVRRIPIKSFEGVRGVTPEGQGYESLLECDYLTLLRFSPDVARFTAQPCTVAYAWGGKKRTSTPDVLVEFRRGDTGGALRATELIEIKPSSIYAAADPLMLAKFGAATIHATEKGWIFRVVTESDLPAGRLENAKFLLRYLTRTIDGAYGQLVIEALGQYQQATVESLIKMCQQSEQNRAQVLTEEWSLIAQRRIGADLDEVLTMQSPLWSLEPE